MRNNSFDEKTIDKLKAYVYALFDPLDHRPFILARAEVTGFSSMSKEQF